MEDRVCRNRRFADLHPEPQGRCGVAYVKVLDKKSVCEGGTGGKSTISNATFNPQKGSLGCVKPGHLVPGVVSCACKGMAIGFTHLVSTL